MRSAASAARGATEAVCRQSTRASGRAEDRGFAGDAKGVAFTAWGDDGDVRKGVWIVDSGSTQHVTADRSQFTSYKELLRDERESWGSSIETDGVVHMEAGKRGGLWEIETVGKQRAFLARGPVKGNRVCATAKRPVRAQSVVKKTVKVVKIDLDDSDDGNGGVERKMRFFVGADETFKSGRKRGGVTVGAKEPEHGVEKTSSEKSDAVRYHESDGGDSGGEWVTPKAKKTARKRSMTS
ncbi:hypothetical protein KFL_006400010 [Klebsormidium nitens]|uniref:Uncharacterized protein n=1 Tax=Klebsormidium nitens TaxID=105231 RepID=A0A1Y1IHT5_KLENI|nr:hypothetical protein KFL_006400010 [Klebsormidium nitens]|eukprot:GAQ90445.1 hypothetical protein KFL_006400010 [Klebsormidium nitens]